MSDLLIFEIAKREDSEASSTPLLQSLSPSEILSSALTVVRIPSPLVTCDC